MFDNVFNGTGCFEGTFLLQLKPDSRPYQMTLRCVNTAEWCNSFVLVPKCNGKVRLCLGPVQLNQVLIKPIHRDPTLNNILPKLNNVKYMSIIDASSRYHNLKLDKCSSNLTTFACQFGRYMYKQLPSEQHQWAKCSNAK